MLREHAPDLPISSSSSASGGSVDVLGIALGPPLDPRTPLPPQGRRAMALLAAVALVAGFLVSSGLVVGREAARIQDVRRAGLIELIAQRQAHAEALSQRRDELRAAVAGAETAATADLPALRGLVADLEALAGTAPVTGPGVRLTLADAAPCRDEAPENCRILDSDLQQAVNALFAAGAEAVAVNGERVIATTALRNAGSTVTVNYRVQTSPYEITAVGEPERLREGIGASEFGRNFRGWTETYGLQFDLRTDSSLDLPAYRGAPRLQTARVSPPGAS